MENSEILKRINSPIKAHIEEPNPRAMILLNGMSNPNIIIIDKPVVVTKEENLEITYGYVDEETKANVLSDILANSEAYQNFINTTLVPMILGFEDAETKVMEDLNAIFEGQANVNLDLFKRVLSKTAMVKCTDFLASQYDLSPAKQKKILEILFNETLERIRYSGDRNRKQEP